VNSPRDLGGREPVSQALRPDPPGHGDFLACFPGTWVRRAVAVGVAIGLGVGPAIGTGRQVSRVPKLSD
jgi:hypothetical protein